MNPENATLTKANGGIVQSDVEFRQGVEVAETLEFIRQDGLRMYIDVDDHDVPIAIEFVHPDGQDVKYQSVNETDTVQITQIVTQLFFYASNMVLVRRVAERSASDYTTDGPAFMRKQGEPIFDRMRGLCMGHETPDEELAALA
ncbi:MAG: hypothetical protein IH987_13790 [Planctomycetes bacterium]|nr:hypothetical protein [Planctomycetota bacterium]